MPTLFLILLTAFAAIDARASTLTVTKTEDTNDNVCDADCSLREAVFAAASGDTVVFSTLFESPQTITLTLGHIVIDKNLTIAGTGPTLVDISANLAGRVFFIPGNLTVTMSGMKLRDGKVGMPIPGEAYGGAIAVNGSGPLNLSDMEFTNNQALGHFPPITFGEGSAVWCDGCTMTLANLYVHHNLGYSAAIQAGGEAVIDIRDSVFTNNHAGVGAATLFIRNTTVSGSTGGGLGSSNLTLIDSQVINNGGRGIYAGNGPSTTAIVENSIIAGNGDYGLSSSATTTIRNTVISNNLRSGILPTGTMYLINSAVTGNRASQGGGIYSYSSLARLYITNSTISGNVSSNKGGGIYLGSESNPAGGIFLVNSTIAHNQAQGQGGGIRLETSPISSSVTNTIIAGNISTNTNEEDVSCVFTSQGSNLIGDTTGGTGWVASDLLNINPMLGPLTDNGGPTFTHAVQNGSPAIDAGNNSRAVYPQTQMFLSDDQRGFPRMVGLAVDIGAYESTQTSSPVIAGTVSYGNSTGSPRFVSGVLINAITSPNVFATTLGAGPGQGTYLLSGFGSGSQTVTATKTGGVNGISSFDAGLVARHAAGITPLMGNQLIVADTSGNGAVTSFDAGQIARYAAGLNNFGSTSNWIFTPSSRTYPSVTTNIAGEDFIALLMGDVSGNWMPAGTSKSNLTEKR
ncbi:MAG: right-handed parallel beta-helix repeat-containing protein [Chloracidobacterium sp.]|nr:right-handed parallel beta-helix repeat-containing protein [Chloracidobacterium sp.]